MSKRKIKLVVRRAVHKDAHKIVELSKKIYGESEGYTVAAVRGQISAFPEGQFIAEYNGEIAGHCATFIIAGEIALRPHNWIEITGQGFASRHDPHGDYLYGMEVSVDERFRGLRIGQRLYDARKNLCADYNLKGIVFGGRMPGYHRQRKKYPDPKDYLQAALDKKVNDPVIGFQTRNDFESIGLLTNYLPKDLDSGGNAVHMIWRNNAFEEKIRDHAQRGRVKDTVRVAAVQFQVRKVDSFEGFCKQIEYFTDVASDYRADFVLFPELLTVPVLSAPEVKEYALTPSKAIEALTEYTERYVDFMEKLAVSYNINIIGGSHPTKMRDGTIENIAYVFLRDGSVFQQSKIHPTPNERYWWNIKGGNALNAIPTDCGTIGVLICYDCEFPETARHLADQGAQIIFVPFCTDERQGYLRVRYCSQARAVENQVYVAIAGIVGNLPDVENMDVHYAQSAIFTPCDFPFARDGVAAETPPNTETVIFADLNPSHLRLSRNQGTVQNLRDRRFDLYRVVWRGDKENKKTFAENK